MKKNEFVMLCLKLMGVYFFLMGLVNVPHVMGDFQRWDFFVSPLLYLLSGSILFFKAPSLVHFILAIDPESDRDIQIHATHTTTAMALQIVGFYILAQGIPGFFQVLATAAAKVNAYNASSIPDYMRHRQLEYVYLVFPAIQICIGLYLILGARGIAHLLQRLNRKLNSTNSSGDSGQDQ